MSRKESRKKMANSSERRTSPPTNISKSIWVPFVEKVYELKENELLFNGRMVCIRYRVRRTTMVLENKVCYDVLGRK